MELLLLQFYYNDNCDVVLHKRTQRKYCMLTCRIFVLFCTKAWWWIDQSETCSHSL